MPVRWLRRMRVTKARAAGPAGEADSDAPWCRGRSCRSSVDCLLVEGEKIVARVGLPRTPSHPPGILITSSSAASLPRPRLLRQAPVLSLSPAAHPTRSLARSLGSSPLRSGLCGHWHDDSPLPCRERAKRHFPPFLSPSLHPPVWPPTRLHSRQPALLACPASNFRNRRPYLPLLSQDFSNHPLTSSLSSLELLLPPPTLHYYRTVQHRFGELPTSMDAH
jgi:hypothetical protein